MATQVPQVAQAPVGVTVRGRKRNGANIFLQAQKLKENQQFRRAGKPSYLQITGSAIKWNPQAARKQLDFIYCLPFRIGGTPAEVQAELAASGLLSAELVQQAINGSLSAANYQDENAGVYTEVQNVVLANGQTGLALGTTDANGNFLANQGATAKAVYEQEISAGKQKRDLIRNEKVANGETLNLSLLLDFAKQLRATKQGVAVATGATVATGGKKSRAQPPNIRLKEVMDMNRTKFLNISDYNAATDTGTRLVATIPKNAVQLGTAGAEATSDALSYLVADVTKANNAAAFLQKLYNWGPAETQTYVQNVITTAAVNMVAKPVARPQAVQQVAVAVHPIAIGGGVPVQPRVATGNTPRAVQPIVNTTTPRPIVPMPITAARVTPRAIGAVPVALPTQQRTPTGTTPRASPRAINTVPLPIRQ
jgi:hypothetical protein